MNQKDCKITDSEFLSLGFHLDDDVPMGTCWKSQQQIIYQGGWLGTEEPDHSRFIYVLRQNRCIDRLNYNRQGYVEDIYDLADFILELKEFPWQGKQLSYNKGLYEQMQNGNRVAYYPGRFNRQGLEDAFREVYESREGQRQIRIQTGEAGMRELNRALIDEVGQWNLNGVSWRQSRLTEQPLLRMVDFEGNGITQPTINSEEGRFTYSVPYREPVPQGADFDVDRAQSLVDMMRPMQMQSNMDTDAVYGYMHSMNVWRRDTDGLEIIS